MRKEVRNSGEAKWREKIQWLSKVEGEDTVVKKRGGRRYSGEAKWREKIQW